MRELIIKVTCDRCASELDEADVTNVEINIGREVYEIDLCGQCDAPFLEGARLLRKKPGRRPAEKPEAVKPRATRAKKKV